ncbi:proteasome regulatory particle base subunit [Dispira parvispora]|uniref:Ribophorin II n=1 Tax=Dispira parvispora TaxID=1520584 RepID=A0A9W8ALY0_9FUNG|nr:proteasome regulatory particle base subunit [Dispira parvispora]
MRFSKLARLAIIPCALLAQCTWAHLTWSISDDAVTVSDDPSGRSFGANDGPLALLPTDTVGFRFQAQLVDDKKSDKRGKPIQAHQAFLLLTHRASGHQVVRVFDSTTAGGYKFTLKPKVLTGAFKQHYGVYDAEVVLGAFKAHQGYRQKIAELDIPAFSSKPKAKKAKTTLDNHFAPKPEITHQHHPEPKQPFVLVSLAFALLCLAPLGGLFKAWQCLGANADLLCSKAAGGKPTCAPGISYAFIGCLASYGILYFLFWTRWNLLDTLFYGFFLTCATIVVGRYALVEVASKRQLLNKA